MGHEGSDIIISINICLCFFLGSKNLFVLFRCRLYCPISDHPNRKHLLNPINSGRMFHLQSGWASFILDKGRWDKGVRERERKNEERNGESNKEGGDFPAWQHKRPQQN